MTIHLCAVPTLCGCSAGAIFPARRRSSPTANACHHANHPDSRCAEQCARALLLLAMPQVELRRAGLGIEIPCRESKARKLNQLRLSFADRPCIGNTLPLLLTRRGLMAGPVAALVTPELLAARRNEFAVMEATGENINGPPNVVVFALCRALWGRRGRVTHPERPSNTVDPSTGVIQFVPGLF